MPLLPRIILRILAVPLPWMLPGFVFILINHSSFKPGGAITMALLAGSMLLGIGLGALAWAYSLDRASVESGHRRDSAASYVIFQVGGIPVILVIAFVVSMFI